MVNPTGPLTVRDSCADVQMFTLCSAEEVQRKGIDVVQKGTWIQRKAHNLVQGLFFNRINRVDVKPNPEKSCLSASIGVYRGVQTDWSAVCCWRKCYASRKHFGKKSHLKLLLSLMRIGQFMAFRRVICKPSIGEGFCSSSMIMSSPIFLFTKMGCLIGWHHFGADDFYLGSPASDQETGFLQGLPSGKLT